MKVGIIGYGVVGKAIDNTLSNEYEIIKYDKYRPYNKFSDLSKCNFIFISVPTPFDYKNYIIDDSAVIESLNELENLSYQGIIIIKSTLPPGSCERYLKDYNLSIVYNPEFLRESTTPNEDFQNQDCVVIGASKQDYFTQVKQMYEIVLLSNATYYSLTFREAEMVKYAQNTMLASRVAIANMIYDACKLHDIDYDTIREIAFDSFYILGPHMVRVPGPDGSRGFGGKCLPKDILGFYTIYNSELLKEIIEYNHSLRKI